MREEIKKNLEIINKKIENACKKSGRNPKDIQLVGVTKTIDIFRINQAIDLGINVIGENKVQEALSKKESVNHTEWHLIGHLQTNKVKKAVEIFDFIHSVDSLKIATEIDKKCKNINKIMPILIQVNTSLESSKFGLLEQEVIDLIKDISKLENVKIQGLMTIGAFTDDENIIRNCFVKLRELFEKIKSENIENVEMKYLSMGMTNDFEIAIEEGANFVRVGSGIFGRRVY